MEGPLSEARNLLIGPGSRKRRFAGRSAGVEDHLGAAEERHGLAGGLIDRLGVPDLSHAAAMDQTGIANHHIAQLRRGQEVRFKFDSGETRPTLGNDTMQP